MLRILLMTAALILSSSATEAATMRCRGFAFIYADLQCDLPTPPATAGALFCQLYQPVRWSSADTRGTKEQVDSLNRTWKRICRK